MSAPPPSPPPRGFTLIELLAVIGIIATLAALLLPALSGARQRAKTTGCLSNLRQVGVAISLYADDYGGSIPYGPEAGAFTSPMNLYPSTGAPTSLISLGNGLPVGLGLLLKHHLSARAQVLFCPATDQGINADLQLARVGLRQAQSSFYYRHGGNTKIFDSPQTSAPKSIKLEAMGQNRNGHPIRALAVDTQFLCSTGMVSYGILPSTHHRGKTVSILYTDGHATSRPNVDARFTVDLRGNANLYDAFSLILSALENADTLD